MIWLFERKREVAKLEVLYVAPDTFEVRFTEGDGTERVEPFTNAIDAGNRQLQLQDILAVQGWSRRGEWKL